MENKKLINYFLSTGSLYLSKSISTVATFSKQINDQAKTILSSLNTQRVSDARLLKQKLKLNPSDDSLRSRAVDLAWKYEQAEVTLGSKGSRDWTDAQLKELLEKGRISGAEGHHIFDVSSNYGKQVNPDNIKFAKSPEEHLVVFHRGEYDNPTTGEYINRNQRVVNSANQTILINEIQGFLTSIGFGFLFGAVASTINQLLTSKGENINLNEVIRSANLSALISSLSHVSLRLVGDEISYVFKSLIGVVGFNSLKTSIGAHFITTSSFVTIIYATLVYFKNRKSMSQKEALSKAKEDLISASKFNLASLFVLLITGSHMLTLLIITIGYLSYEVITSKYLFDKEINLNHSL